MDKEEAWKWYCYGVIDGEKWIEGPSLRDLFEERCEND